MWIWTSSIASLHSFIINSTWYKVVKTVRSYKILFGLISRDTADLFEVRQATATRGHPYKLFKPQRTINARSSFFTQRIINVWNDLPVNTINFSSLNCFRNSLNKVDVSSYLVLG